MGGHSQKAQPGYQPAGQAQADQSFTGLINSATPWVTNLPQQTIPGMEAATANITNNPYAGSMLSGAADTASLASAYSGLQNGYAANLQNMGSLDQQLAGWQSQVLAPLIQQSQGLGNDAQAAGLKGWQQTQGLIPSTTQGGQYANGALGQAANLANLTSGTALGAIPGLTGGMDAASQILQTAFDPQGALYNRQYQQMMDQQNAINSQNGVAGGAYGAGLVGDASRNFNIDWQNNQLQRQISGLGAYGTEQSTVANNLTNLLGSAAGNYANLSNAGVNQYNSLTSTAANNMSNLVNTGFNVRNAGDQTNLAAIGQAGALTNDSFNNSLAANTNASQMYDAARQQQTGALNTALTGSQLPYQTYLGQQGDVMNALSNLAAGGAQSLSPLEGLAGMDATYMGLGQSATALQQKAAQINNATSGGIGQAIGQMAGTAASVAMHFI